MSTPPPPGTCRDPFELAIEALISGDASPLDHTILNDTLRADPEARRSYIQTIAFEAMLAQEFAPVAKSQSPAPRRHRRWLLPLSVAASVALAGSLAWRLAAPSIPPQPHPTHLAFDDEEITHAVISSLDEARGRFAGGPLAQGLRLTGGMLELESGIAEITFDTGAEVTLEGPARLQLESQSKSRLDAGRASAHIPEEARGFVIHTPSSYIRDLGTAFAVEVRDGRETDLHVLEGEVEVAAIGRRAAKQPKILYQREAVRLAGGDILPISFKPSATIQRRKKNAPKIPPSVHWSFDTWDGATTTDASRGHLLTFQSHGRPTAPETIDGPFGRALHLDGNGTFARSDYPGIGGSQARTVVCWICIQPGDGQSPENPSSFISWGLPRSTAKWQLAWNRNKTQGNIGAPRVEFGDGSVVGSTDLRDGRWHHLAVVYLGGSKASVATHVRIYLDGKLEPLTGRRQQRINTDTKSADANPVTIGRHLGVSPALETMTFEGDLDEAYVFEGPLLPGQIVRLKKTNTLRPGKP